MIQKGDLTKIGFLRILQWLIVGDKAGTIKLSRTNERKFLQFKSGKLLSASSDCPRERLWLFFYRSGRLNEKQLKDLQSEERTSGERFEQIAIRRGFISKDDADNTRVEQARSIIMNLFTWTEGEFYFFSDRFLQHEGDDLDVPLADLLREGMMSETQFQRLLADFGDQERPLIIDAGKFAARVRSTIQPGPARIFTSLAEQQTVAEVCDRSLYGKFETLQFLDTLQRDGIISLPGRHTAERDRRIAESVDLQKKRRYWQAFRLLQQLYETNPTDTIVNEQLKLASERLAADMKEQISSLERVPRIEREIDPALWKDLALDASDGFIISRLDGATSLKHLCASIKMDKKKILTTIYRLLLVGVIVLVSPVEDADALDAHRRKIRRIVSQLKDKNLYERLGLLPGAELKDIKQAYHNLAKQYHPDVLGEVNDPLIKEGYVAAFELLQDAYNTLAIPRSRQRYDIDKGYSQDTPENAERLRMVERARLQFNLGVRHFRSRDYHRALEYIQSAIDLYPDDPVFYGKLAEVCSKNPRWYRTGKSACRRAIELDPENASYYVLLALILKQEGNLIEAERHFVNSLRLDPTNAIAKRELKAMNKSLPDETPSAQQSAGREIALHGNTGEGF